MALDTGDWQARLDEARAKRELVLAAKEAAARAAPDAAEGDGSPRPTAPRQKLGFEAALARARSEREKRPASDAAEPATIVFAPLASTATTTRPPPAEGLQADPPQTPAPAQDAVPQAATTPKPVEPEVDAIPPDAAEPAMTPAVAAAAGSRWGIFAQGQVPRLALFAAGVVAGVGVTLLLSGDPDPVAVAVAPAPAPLEEPLEAELSASIALSPPTPGAGPADAGLANAALPDLEALELIVISTLSPADATRRLGVGPDEMRATPFTVEQSEIHFFNGTDAPAAALLAKRLNAELLDLSGLEPSPPAGTISVYIADS
ncbi:MAG: hypothetical protein AAGE18_17940 [Pseudomonadota bacterium]